MRASVSSPGAPSPLRSASATACSLSGPTRARTRPSATSNERLHGLLLAGLGQQALDGELKIVDLLEREVHALGDAADDQPDDGLEVAGQRGL